MSSGQATAGSKENSQHKKFIDKESDSSNADAGRYSFIVFMRVFTSSPFIVSTTK
jgi:hypothetical protein